MFSINDLSISASEYGLHTFHVKVIYILKKGASLYECTPTGDNTSCVFTQLKVKRDNG